MSKSYLWVSTCDDLFGSGSPHYDMKTTLISSVYVWISSRNHLGRLLVVILLFLSLIFIANISEYFICDGTFSNPASIITLDLSTSPWTRHFCDNVIVGRAKVWFPSYILNWWSWNTNPGLWPQPHHVLEHCFLGVMWLPVFQIPSTCDSECSADAHVEFQLLAPSWRATPSPSCMWFSRIRWCKLKVSWRQDDTFAASKKRSLVQRWNFGDGGHLGGKPLPRGAFSHWFTMLSMGGILALLCYLCHI